MKIRNLFLFFALFPCFLQTLAQAPYKIPVVVHVIHADGAENISDAQIKNGIEVLTRNWRKRNPDTTDIVAPFQSVAADMEVEFELAKLDPLGRCTNGINRIRSEMTTTGTHNVKSLIHWPADRYLNVYVVRNAAGLAGHALMPFQADSVPAWDGIVISGNYFGSIGTSDPVKSVVLSHEVGHYLNLYHIWGGNNVPGFYYLPVGQAGNCAVGDSVADTPPTRGWSTCNLAGNSCGAGVDNVQNFMDYAYCARMFTQGQKQRVHAALNSPLADRDKLWKPANLAQTGLDSDAPLCVVDFTSPRRIYCHLEPVTLTDASYHDPVSWNWNLGDGSWLNGANVTYTYPSPGKYDIQLGVSDGVTLMSTTKPGYLKILEAQGQPLPYIEGFETTTDLNQNAILAECEGYLCFRLENGIAATGQKSISVPNGNGPTGKLYRVTTPRLDFSQTPDPVIRFRYAFAQRDTGNTDKLLVKISRDCGVTWQTRKTVSAAELPTVSTTVPISFVPGSGDWREVTVGNIPASFKTDNLLVRIEFYSGGGSHFYLDDINIFDLSELSVPVQAPEEWLLAPNPTRDDFRVEGPFDEQEVELYSADGKRVLHREHVPKGQPVSVSGLPAGLYRVKLNYKGVIVFRKLLILND